MTERSVQFTVARIVADRPVPGGDNGATAYDLEIVTSDGIKTFTNVVPSGEGLLFGAWVGGKFIPVSPLTSARTPGDGIDPGGGGGNRHIRAIIGPSTQIGDGQYRYLFQEATGPAQPSLWTVKPGGILGSCHQPLEGGTGTTLYSGIDKANLGDNFEPVPIAEGARAILVEVDSAWYIQTAQAVDGACPGAV